MQSVQLFIGANNDTKQVEKEKILSILDTYLIGYTMSDANGSWKGQREPSVIVDFLADENTPIDIILAHLKESLHQEAIGYRVIPALQFFA